MTIATVLMLRGHELSKAAADFRTAAAEDIERLDNSIALALSQVNALGAVFDIDGVLDRRRFKILAKTLIWQTPSLQALEWVPRVTADKRDDSVQAARRDGIADFDFTERMDRGHMASAARRSEYFPVYYIEPMDGNREALGFDLASDAERQRTLHLARDAGQMAATGRILLVQEKRHGYGFLALRPVYRGGKVPLTLAGRQAELIGYVLGVFKVSDIVERTRHGVSSVDLAAFDATADTEENKPLYPDGLAYDAARLTPAQFNIVRQLDIAGRTWTIVAKPVSGTFEPSHTASNAVLLFGLLLTGMLATFLREREIRMDLIEAEVEARTRELDRERNFGNAVFDSAGVVIMVIDRAGEVVRFNSAAQAFTGYGLEQVIGRPFIWLQFMSTEDRAGANQVFQLFLERNLPKRFAGELIGRDGERRRFEWTNTFLPDDEGEPEYLVTVGLDITERVRYENSLRDSEALFRRFFERNNASMLMVDPEQGNIIDANAAACDFYGWSREEFRQRRMDQINTLPAATIQAEMEAAMAEQRNHFVFRHRLADGSERSMEVHSTPVLVGGEKVLFSILHDVTEREAALAALQAESAKNHALLMNVVDGIHILDQSGFLIEANPAFFAMLGYTRDELIGRPLSAWDAKWSEHELNGRVLPMLRQQGKIFETRHRRKDGSVIEVEVSASGVQIGQENLLYCSARDITERNRVNEALHENELKFHTMVDWTYDWEYWVGSDGRFVYITPSVERVTGYRPAQFVARQELLDEIVHPEDRHLWHGHVCEHIPDTGGNEVGEVEYRIVRGDGETRWVNHICRAVYDQAGHYLGRRVAVRDTTDRKRAEDEIKQLAYFDSLTHLPNRRLLMDRLGQAMNASRRNKQFGTLMILDLDHFKTLNDTQGHDVGDRLLIEVANRLQACTRQEDTVARLGGDEFVIMVEDLSKSERSAAGQAEAVAEKIRAAISLPYALGGAESDYVTTPSIGLTLFMGQETSAEVLLKQADVALYQAKDAGRNRVRFFNPIMQAAIDSRAQLENALRHALDKREFHLYYQPQVDATGRVIGAEALIRWLSPEQGLVLPAQFIPLSEETGLILQLGEWVIQTACRQLREWMDRPGTANLQLSVNVSARQFRQPDFVDRVRQALNESGADPSRLMLELTETVLLDSDEFVSHMQQLDGLGVKFSLDDFGTGYSSLSYLKRLPIDQLKIDQVFIRDVNHDPNDAAIVRAVLAMSESLGFDIIAEGVETEEQRRFLIENGCRSFQGYLFGKPMPVGELIRLL